MSAAEENAIHPQKKPASPKSIIVFILAVIILSSITFAGIQKTRQGNNQTINPPQPDQAQNLPPTYESLPSLASDTTATSTIVYAEKLDEKITFASAINSSGNNNTKISALREEVKSIIPLLNAGQLLFIGDINASDKGKSLKIKTITPEQGQADGQTITIYSASSPTSLDYKIDKLIISPNHAWIAWSENSPVSGEEDLHEKNHFRSFKAKISGKNIVSTPLNPISLTQEKSNTGITIHIPELITDDGDVYFDGIKPAGYFINDGLKNETLKTTILQVNSYNSHPYLFNNNYIIYTSYNPDNKPKIPAINSTSARVQVINRNSVKISSLQSPASEAIIAAPGDEGEHYAHPVFLSGNPNGQFSIAVEVFNYDASDETSLAQKEIQIITRLTSGGFKKTTAFEIPKGESYRILAVDKSKIIIAKETETLGNLGSGWYVGGSSYQKMIREISILDGNLATPVPLPSATNEFLGILPKPPDKPLGIARNELLNQLIPTIMHEGNKDQLQLYTFLPVAIKREYSPEGKRKNPRTDCVNDWKRVGYHNYEICEACPVYIYSNKIQNITLRPKTPIDTSSAAPALSENAWTFRADNKGNLLFPDNTLRNRIDFLFPRPKIEEPKTGEIIAKKDYGQALYQYAKNLGFNDREASDATDYFLPDIQDSPFIFLSHLPPAATKKLLDLEAYPAPQILETRIFYIKKINNPPAQKPDKPIFNAITRNNGDLIVVTWGGIIK